MKFKLDDWKKVSQGEKHTVLRNKQGHELRIFHSKLSPQIQKQLAALPAALAESAVKSRKGQMMAKGGEVPKPEASKIPGGPGSPAMDPKQVGGDVNTSGDPVYEKFKKWMGYADGGDVSSMPQADTEESIIEDAQAAPVRPEYTEALAKEQANSNPQMDAVYGSPEQRAQQDINKIDQDASMKAQYDAQQANIHNVAGIQPPQTLKTASDAPQSPAAPQPTAHTTPVATPPPSDPYGAEASYNALTKGIQEEKAGNEGIAAASNIQAQAELKARDAQAAKQQELVANYQSHFKHLDDERAALQEDIKNGHIDPTHYLGNMSTGSRIATGIGLMLGGIGAGMTGGPNQALEFFNKQIDRDIDAQKATLGKKESLLSANMKQFNNLRDATDMTKIMMADTLANQIGIAAAKAQGPMAKSIAEKANGVIDRETTNLQGDIAMRRAQGAGQGGGISNQIQMWRLRGNEAMAKSLEERYVPGITDASGKEVLASRPVPKEMRDKIMGHQEIAQSINNLKGLLAKGNAMSPRDRDIASQDALLIQSKLREGWLGTVYREGEQPLLNTLVSKSPLNITDRAFPRELNKLNGLLDKNRSLQNIVHKNAGLPEVTESSGLNPQERAYYDWAKKNPGNPKATAVLKKLGIQ